MSTENEKDYNDYVYEDEYYDKEFSGNIPVNPEEEYKIEEENEPKTIAVILVCQECMNRWDDIINNDSDTDELFCPYCGSKKVDQI